MRRGVVGLGAGAGIVAVILGAGYGLAMGAEGGSDPRPPRVQDLNYYEERDASPFREMSVVARRTRSLKFATRFDGERATARGRHKRGSVSGDPGCPPNVSDRDLPPRCRLWHPIRRDGGSGVLRLTHEALEATGEAKIRVRARRKDQVDDIVLTIVDAECAHDWPFYPRICFINRHSESIISP